MGNDDLQHRLGERLEAALDRRHLLLVDAPVLERERARGVDADDRDLVVDERRLEVGLDDATVLAERAEKALPDAVQRHVVIARNDDLRARQAIEKGACVLELALAGALREVARDDDDIGLRVAHGREQRLDQLGVDAAEVKVGEVNEGSHGRAFLSRTRRSAAASRSGWPDERGSEAAAS